MILTSTSQLHQITNTYILHMLLVKTRGYDLV